MRTLFSLVLAVGALLHNKETSHSQTDALVATQKKVIEHKELKATKNETAAADNTTAEETAAEESTEEPKAVSSSEPLRCELILQCSLETIHDKGGVEAFANAAESELAHAAGVDRTCIHIMNLRGKYKHGMKALEFLQSMFNRDAGTEVIVDFEILPCGDQGAAFTKVEEALKDDKSSLKTGWLSSFLGGATVVQGSAPSEGAVSKTTMSVGPVPEKAAAVALAVLAVFLRA